MESCQAPSLKSIEIPPNMVALGTASHLPSQNGNNYREQNCSNKGQILSTPPPAPQAPELRGTILHPRHLPEVGRQEGEEGGGQVAAATAEAGAEAGAEAEAVALAPTAAGEPALEPQVPKLRIQLPLNLRIS